MFLLTFGVSVIILLLFLYFYYDYKFILNMGCAHDIYFNEDVCLH